MFEDLDFDGDTYERKHDQVRLAKQLSGIYAFMSDGGWHTLQEIHDKTGYPPASISAGLRDFRKERFGKHQVNKRSRGNRASGLWEYQFVPNKQKSLVTTS